MSASLLFRMMWRQARGARGRLLFFVACIAVGVAAVVGVAALVDTVELGVRTRSRELLGADLAIESRQPLPDPDSLLRAELGDDATRLPRATLTLLPTMARTDAGSSRLVEVKAIATERARFPLAGTLALTPARPLHELLRDDSVVIARAIADGERLRVGDGLHIGGKRFAVGAILEREDEPLGFSFVFGPRVLMTQAGLAATGLTGQGQRVRHKLLYALPSRFKGAQLARLQAALEARIPGGGTQVRIETHEDAQPALRRTLERVQSYLGMVALLSLLIASVGVAQIASAWIAQAAPETAVLRCLGMRPREVLLLYLGHVLLLAIAGSALGALLGASLPSLVLSAHPELAPRELAFALPVAAVLRGMLLGVGVALAFSVPPLTAVWQVSPARVLRAEVAPLPIPLAVRALAGVALAASVLIAAYVQTGELRTTLFFSGGVAALAAVLWLAARGLLRAIASLPRARLPVIAWHGAAALTRPSAGTTGSIVALGMGTLVVLGVALIEDVLAREVAQALPKDAPSVFLVDVQPEQWPEVERIVRAHRATELQSVPVVMARLKAVAGRTVGALVAEREAALRKAPTGQRDRAGDQERPRAMLTREQRITMLRTLSPSNEIVAGALWSRPDMDNEISLEQEFARDLGAGLGSRLTFDVQGVPIEFVVTSLRKIEWRSFSVNFFLVAEPDGPLADAPRVVLGAARIPAELEQSAQNQLAERFPNVTVMRVRALIERAAELLAQVATAVRLLGAFAALTGLVILAGAVASTQLRRAREAALLKALGVTRARVAGLFAVEYALTGSVAAFMAAFGAYALT
ncbi:MAG TPA: FtsX-like permease family protein, partial [Polyangiales bacterium]|nr:FtsX-like permease family protein [Polyangiales bacterium]